MTRLSETQRDGSVVVHSLKSPLRSESGLVFRVLSGSLLMDRFGSVGDLGFSVGILLTITKFKEGKPHQTCVIIYWYCHQNEPSTLFY